MSCYYTGEKRHAVAVFLVVSPKSMYKKQMPGALPSEESLLVLLGRVGMSRKSYKSSVNQLAKKEKYFR